MKLRGYYSYMAHMAPGAVLGIARPIVIAQKRRLAFVLYQPDNITRRMTLVRCRLTFMLYQFNSIVFHMHTVNVIGDIIKYICKGTSVP